MQDSIMCGEVELNPSTFAVKRWLRMACDRLHLYPKAMYLEIGVDAGTWSRWTSYEDERTVPMGYLPAILALLDEQAFYDLQDIVRPRKSESGFHTVVPSTKKGRPATGGQ